MDVYVAEVIALAAYKIVSLLVGLSLCYMGYRLFSNGIWGNAGDAEGSFLKTKLILKKAAPGTFFVLLGSVVIGATIAKGMHFNKTISHMGAEHEKPVLLD